MLCLTGFLTYPTITDYKPAEIETLPISKSTLPNQTFGCMALCDGISGAAAHAKKMNFFFEEG